MANGNQHTDRKAIGQNIRKIRQSAGLSLRRLAALCRIDHADISKIERADIDPQLSTLLELAEALRVHPNSFFSGYKAEFVSNGNGSKAVNGEVRH